MAKIINDKVNKEVEDIEIKGGDIFQWVGNNNNCYVICNSTLDVMISLSNGLIWSMGISKDVILNNLRIGILRKLAKGDRVTLEQE